MDSFLQKENYTHKDIEQLLHNSADESLYLEFKSAEALVDQPKTKTEISKDVSSFANADGGIIIYGVKEGKDRRATEITYVDTRKFSKEWLEQVIDSNIQRRISGIRIYLIQHPTHKNQGVYVVKIPASPQAPHMASDMRFYRRQNFTTTQIEEYQVRELYNRKGRTELKVHKIEGTNGYFQNVNGVPSIMFNLEILIANVSNSIEDHYKLEFAFPGRLLPATTQHSQVQSYVSRYEEGYVIYSVAGKVPIFQNEIIPMAIIILQVNQHSTYEIFRNGELRIKLYYSNGVKEITHSLYNLLTYLLEPIDREPIKQ